MRDVWLELLLTVPTVGEVVARYLTVAQVSFPHRKIDTYPGVYIVYKI